MSFDNIDLQGVNCPNPKCGIELTGFTSTQGPCQHKTFPYYAVNSFQTQCQCGTEVTYTKKFFPMAPIQDYQMSYIIPKDQLDDDAEDEDINSQVCVKD